MRKDGSPGPDGFTAEFFRVCWDVVKQDTVAAVQAFFSSGFMLRQLNHSFIALIPKSKAADTLDEFRPISLCNTVYKLITKCMASHIQCFLPRLISPHQSTFIKDRNIAHSTLLAHELVHYLNTTSGVGRACIKIDLKKAFDSVRWPFLEAVLKGFKFPAHWVQMISNCVSTTSFSILVNGSPKGFFTSSCGLRQGDPLSPLLCVLIMESFSVQFNEELSSKRIGKFLAGPSSISHLCFADDLMLFTDSKPCSAQNICKLFDHFATTSGLHLNTTKSQAFLGGDPADNDCFLHLLGIRNHNLPVKYLGLPLFLGVLSSRMCFPLDKIRRRIEGWVGHLLSYAGRLELLKTVLSSFHNYWTAGFTLPRKIQRSIEQILRRFLWGGPKLQAKIHHVSWDLICHPKQEGGLGIRNIKDWSKASMAARFWEVITHSKSLWTDWIWNRYLKRKSPWEVNSNSGCSWVWHQILSNRDWIKAEVKYIIFSGHTINILHDPWLEGKGLAHHLQGSLSSLPFLSPSATLSAIIKDGKWIRPPRWPSQLTALWPTILEIEIGGVGDDEIIWPHCKQGVLSTQAAWAYLRHSRPPAPWKN
ncbi:hypothetical protein QJS10_CPB17g00255 [Acorus calamus]|uniref:Reverse transcriptase domain-containing protein n=1 Tax=Acorus calamus TaxID=4465 RepID=A0AAV9CV32_ACOCL|nr:hypothetical protein QJS10_CPB17g00255 [Acorus calamus]